MSDDDLRQAFKALRATDERRAPALESTLAKASSVDRAATSPARRPARWFWPLGLATAAIAIVTLALQQRARPRETRSTAVEIARLTDEWTTPSDSLLAESPGLAGTETAERLTKEINQLLQR